MNNPDEQDSGKASYESVKNDPVYELVKETWDFLGEITSFADIIRKYNISAVRLLKYKYAYLYEKRDRETRAWRGQAMLEMALKNTANMLVDNIVIEEHDYIEPFNDNKE